MLRRIAIVSISTVLFTTVVSARAATIALWTFESSQPTTEGPIAPEVGAGSATVFHDSPNSYTNPSGNGSAESYNTNSWTVGDFFQFQVSTLGLAGITFAWDQTRSSSGPGFQDLVNPNFKLQYSTDGTAFTDVVEYVVPVVTWSSGAADASTMYSQNLSAITALDNQAAVYFRLTSILPDQETSANGTSRVDNVSVSAVPEPGTWSLAAVIVVSAMRRRSA